MSILTVENVSHGFGERVLLDNASFRLLNGEHVGLVGANGEGKSTFLNIITGKLMPDNGNISWCKCITTGFIDQYSQMDMDKTMREVLAEAFLNDIKLESEMLAMYEQMGDVSGKELEDMLEDVGNIQSMLETSGYYSIDYKIEEVANGLGLGEVGLDRKISELSGGQRAKAMLTKLLLEKPMILILDEPTNFLDENHIEWLANYLNNYDNAFILVSHDVAFLNKVVNIIFHVENAQLTRYVGNYDEFMRTYEQKKNQKLAAYERQQKEIDRLEDFVARNKARVATSNMAKSRQKQLDSMDVITLDRERPKPSFAFEMARTPGRFIISAKDLVIGYDSPLTSKLNLTLERGQKIAIRGVNGLGKTTLLKTLLDMIPPISGAVELDHYLQVAYFEQLDRSESDNTALEEIWKEVPHYTNGQVRAALAKCGLTTQHIENKVRVLSGGENVKVRLCKLMLRPANFLVLDEPTNHLDPEAKEELARCLTAFKGTVLLVSHEPAFYQCFVTDVWDLHAWTTKEAAIL